MSRSWSRTRVAGADGRGRDGDRIRGAAAEVLGHEANDLLVGDVPGHRDDEVGGPVAGRPEVADVRVAERAHRVLVAGDLPAQRRVAEVGLVPEVEDELAGVVAIGADLLDDDVALPGDVLAAQ